MAAFAVGWLRELRPGPDIDRYVKKIDATLAPFKGKFRVHGARAEVLEGEWIGDFVLIEFPTLEAARDWYESDAYKELIPLRAQNSHSVVFLIDGVPDSYRAIDLLMKRTAAKQSE
jgi:uncharacterized protein (DUF1330 family)